MLLSPPPSPLLSKQFRIETVQEPAFEPITAADYATYTRIGTTGDANAIADKIRAARMVCESATDRTFMSTMRDLFIDLPPGVDGGLPSTLSRLWGYLPESIEIPKPPLQAIVGVYVTDDTGAETLVDPSAYWVGRVRNPGRVTLRQSGAWPDTAGRLFETFRVRFTAGYCTPFTSATSHINTVNPHGRVNGDVLRFSVVTGALPVPLVANTDYYVVNAAVSGFQVSAINGGSALTFSADASGQVYFGILPSRIRRAILATAFSDSAPEKRKSSKYDVAEEGSLPAIAKELLKFERFLRV